MTTAPDGIAPVRESLASENKLNNDPPRRQPTFLEKNSLPLAGALNLIGDVAFLKSGMVDRNPFRTTAGAFYTLGGLNLALYGHINKHVQMQDVVLRIANHMEMELGGECHATAEHLRHTAESISNPLERFLSRKPGDNTMALYTAGAATMFASGLRQFRRERDFSELAYGSSSLTFKLLSFMIPEKSRDTSGEESKGGFADWIKEKPLRVFGAGSFITDSLLAWNAYEKYKRNPLGSGHVWTGITSATFMAADALMAISYKDPSNLQVEFTPQEQQRLECLLAEAILSSPKQNQGKIMECVADYLATQPEISSDLDNASIRKTLGELVTIAPPKSWTDKVAKPQETAISR